MSQKLKITMADGKVLHVERYWYDTFFEGLGATVVHQNKKRVMLTKRWIVMIEDDSNPSQVKL